MDLYDTQQFFTRHVPTRTLDSQLLQNAVAAIASKHLGRIRGSRSHAKSWLTEPSTMEIYPGAVEVDWYFKAANYYYQALISLRQILPELQESSSHDELPGSTYIQSDAVQIEDYGSHVASITENENNDPDDLLAATCILSVYEFLDASNVEWIQ